MFVSNSFLILVHYFLYRSSYSGIISGATTLGITTFSVMAKALVFDKVLLLVYYFLLHSLTLWKIKLEGLLAKVFSY